MVQGDAETAAIIYPSFYLISQLLVNIRGYGALDDSQYRVTSSSILAGRAFESQPSL